MDMDKEKEKEQENLFQDCSFWEEASLMDQNDHPFDSALSSMVCSPTASTNGKKSIVVKELIGRLGNICNSSDISAFNGGNSASASCYSTPLNSPHKMKSPAMENQWITENLQQQHQIYTVSCGGFSCFTNTSHVVDPSLDCGKIYGSPTFAGPGDSKENSSLSELIPAKPRNRKISSKGKGKETPGGLASSKDASAPFGNSQISTKRCKSEEKWDNSEKDVPKAKPAVNLKQNKEDSKLPEPPKDYIHVRARRGQATDAHSLAERVRREKISERMKLLQDLVPGCNKVAGKAVMLDEIINYVQSLQRQVEFLSMKLATITPRKDCSTETPVVKDMCQYRESFHHYVHLSESYPFNSQPNLHGAMPTPNRMNTQSTSQLLDCLTVRNHRKQSPPMEIYSETASRVPMFWEDDLHSLVQMGFTEAESQKYHGILPPTHMKIEH